MRRLTVLAALLILAGCTTMPPAQPTKAMRAVSVVSEPCLTESLPLLMDSSNDPNGVPWVKRSIGVQLWQQGGSQFLVANVGNELNMWQVNNPATPTQKTVSHFGVPPFGDRDQNLFNVTIGHRYGYAGYDAQGAVLFDTGTLAGHPSLSAFHYYPEASGIGGLMFTVDGTDYLIAKNLPGSCIGKPTLWRVNGLTSLEQVQCLSAGTQAIGCDGGYRVSDSTGDYLVIADQSRRGYVFRIDPGPQLTYTGVWYYAPTSTGHGLAVDVGHGLAASAFGHVRLYDVSTGVAAPRLVADFEPETAHVVSLVALSWPYLWVAVTAGNAYAYDISDPSNPVRVDEALWAAPSYDYSQFRDAVFTDDGQWMFLARFSVLQRFAVSDGCLVPSEAIFSDGVESGSTAEWSEVRP